MQRIFVDTDIGSDIDDALALLLALHLQQVKILGISTVYGKVELRARVARKLVQLTEQAIPVACGISRPMASPIPIWHTGREGCGLLNEEDENRPLQEISIARDGVALLLRQTAQHPGEVTVVALGALTNIAEALQRAPQLTNMIRRIVFMGAGVTYPNALPQQITPGQVCHARPSHNVRCDVQAARAVFSAGVPMTIVTNDVTTSLWLEGEAVERFRTATTPLVAAVWGMFDDWLKYRSKIFKRPISGTCPHDPLTMAIATNRCPYSAIRGRLEVLDDASTNFTVDPESPIELVTRIDEVAFLKWLAVHLHQPEP